MPQNLSDTPKLVLESGTYTWDAVKCAFWLVELTHSNECEKEFPLLTSEG